MSPKCSLAVLVLGLAALASFRSPRQTSAEPAVALSSGHAHDNLTVFILRGPDVLESKNILTLQEALERNLAIVHETSSVNMLEVENLSPDHELFLQSGDIVKGGKQDRLVSQDLLIQAKSGRVPCPANCCEHSRWQQRGGEAAGRFEKSTDFAVGNSIKLANVSQQQGAVWDNVQKTQKALSDNLGKSVTANASPTSLQLALEDKDLRAKVAAYERDLAALPAAYPDAVGVVIAVNGQVIASDVYGSRQLFQKAWPKLLKSAAVDAVAQMPKDGAAIVATREEAAKFLVAQAESDARTVGAAFTFEPVDEPNRVQLGRAPTADDVQELLQSAANVSDPAAANLNGALRDRQREAAGTTRFAGRSGATSQRSSRSGGANRNETVVLQGLNSLNPTGDGLRVDNLIRQSEVQAQIGYNPRSAPAPAVVSFESRAGSQKNALIHRGQLKK